MRELIPHFPIFAEILNLKSKREVVRHCNVLTVHQRDLVALILAAQHGVLFPYRYTNHFSRSVSDHLHPNQAEHEAIASNGVGKLQTRGVRKLATKIFQLFREQRALAAHLIYTADHRYWHLFYFDNRDIADSHNHWRHGAHIHYVSDLWPGLTLRNAWAQVISGELAFANKLHIRFTTQ
jgi:hypothetical protein